MMTPPPPTWQEAAELLCSAQFADAESLCRAGLAVQPADPRWTLGLAWALIYQYRGNEAVTVARVAVDAVPNQAEAYRALAFATALTGDLTTAAAIANFALQLDPYAASSHALRRIQRASERGDTNTGAILPRPRDALGLSLEHPGPATDTHRVLLTRPTGDMTTTARVPLVPALEAQAGALLGASVFGPWVSLDDESLGGTGPVRRARLRPTRVVAVLIIAVLAGAVAALVYAGLARQQHRESLRQARELRAYLQAGDLERVASYAGGSITVGEDLRARVDATLFRFHDADPVRLERVARQVAVDAAGGSYDLIVARALLVGHTERFAMLGDLRAVSGAEPRDPMAHALIATTLAAAGDDEGATAAFAAAGNRAPDNVLLLALETCFLQQQGKSRAARGRLDELRDLSPRSPWVTLATVRQQLPPPPGSPAPADPPAAGQSRPTRPGEPPAPPPAEPGAPPRSPSRSPADEPSSGSAEASPEADPPPPVVAGELEVARAVAAWARGDRAAGERHLARALEATGHQAPFLLDVVDELVQRGLVEAARSVTTLERWPRERLGATVASGRLALAQGDPATARRLLTRAWEGGLRSRVVGQDLVTASRQVAPQDPLARAIARELAGRRRAVSPPQDGAASKTGRRAASPPQDGATSKTAGAPRKP